MTTPLDGYKTYIVAACGLAIVVMLYMRGDLSGADVLTNTMVFLGLGTLRHGVQTGE